MRIEHTVFSRPFSTREGSEDAVAVQDVRGHFLAVVADGHGVVIDEVGNTYRKSATVARFAQDLTARLCEQASDPSRLVESFDTAARSLEEIYRPMTEVRHAVARARIGAVVSAILVTDSHIHLAQTGDCRLYVADKARANGFRQLCVDHNGKNPGEKERLKPLLDSGEFRLGIGHELPVGFPASYGWRLFRREGLGYVGGLMPTRSFGDWEYLPAVTHTPECRSIELSEFAPGRLFALCSDGGNRLVEAAFKRVRRRIMSVPMEELTQPAGETEFFADDVTVVFFRVT